MIVAVFVLLWLYENYFYPNTLPIVHYKNCFLFLTFICSPPYKLACAKIALDAEVWSTLAIWFVEN